MYVNGSVISAGINSGELAKRGESLIRQSSNRYLTTVRIAFRAKQRRFDDFDGLLEESSVKPVQRAIVELSDESRINEIASLISGTKITETAKKVASDLLQM